MHKIKRRDKLREEALRKKKQAKKTAILKFPITKEQALKRDYKFWDTQPVPKLTEFIGRNEVIDKDICNNIVDQPEVLPDGYEWTTFDITNDDHLNTSNR